MKRQQWILPFATKGCTARPTIQLRIRGHSYTNRIEVDVAHATKYMRLAVDQARLITAFPEPTGRALAGIELPNVAPTKCCIILPMAPGFGGVSSKWTWLSITTTRPGCTRGQAMACLAVPDGSDDSGRPERTAGDCCRAGRRAANLVAEVWRCGYCTWLRVNARSVVLALRRKFLCPASMDR